MLDMSLNYSEMETRKQCQQVNFLSFIKEELSFPLLTLFPRVSLPSWAVKMQG